MEFITNKLAALKEDGFRIDIGDVISESFELWKKTIGISLLFILSMIVISIVVYGILGIVFFGSLSELVDMVQHNPAAFSSEMSGGKAIVVLLVVQILLNCIFSPLLAGYFYLLQQTDETGSAVITDIFVYFNPPYFMQIVIATAIVTLISSICSNIILKAMPTASMLSLVVSLVIYSFNYYTVLLIIFADRNAIDALKDSVSLALKNYLSIILLVIISFVFAMLGLVLLCLGIFITISFMYIFQYITYKQVIGFQEPQTEIESIGEM